MTPLLDGELARRARAAAADIVDAVVSLDPAAPGLGGCAGHAVLLAHAGTALDDEALVARAGEMLDAAVAGVGGAPGPHLWGGMAGVRWAVGHLADGPESDEACATLDDALAAAAARLDAYDLVGGLVGIGIASSRAAPTVLARLEALATDDDDALFWHTPAHLLPDWQRATCPGGYTNLGLAHGMPGIVGLGARWIAAGFEAARARRLVEGAVTWMLRTFPPREGGRFPAWHAPGTERTGSRLAWCYGDPGAAVTLLAAARATGRADWEAEAVDLGRRMARRPFDTSGVVDTGFCHGAAGVAHLFHRMYRATGDAVLGEAARVWIERLLAMRLAGEPYAGFPAWLGPAGDQRWAPDATLIGGAGGVALVLLAAISDEEPAWDEVFVP